MASHNDRPELEHPCNYGWVAVLKTRPDGIQCHICGEWWVNLAAHALRSHDLSADDYRAAFGLMKKTKLVAPALREAQRQRTAGHLQRVGTPHREALKRLSTEERRRRALSAERREEHALNGPGPERADTMLEARFGPEQRVPDQVLQGAVDVFVEELGERSRGVWARTGERLGIDWSTARMLVHTAADRGLIELDGTRTDLTARLLDRTVIVPPDSFLGRLALLERYGARTGSRSVHRSAVFEGVAIGTWVASVQNRWRNGTLTNKHRDALEALSEWKWPEPGPYTGGAVPRSNSDAGVNLALWNAAFDRLERYVETHGHAQVPSRYRDDDGYTLGAWVGNQRRKRRTGELHGNLVERLERQPGWEWSPPIGRPPPRR